MTQEEKKVIERLDIDGMIDLAQRLIRIKNVNPPGDYFEISKVLHQEMQRMSLRVEIIEGYPGKINVFGILPGYEANGVTFLLSGHMDVVPVGDQKEWTHDPFGGEVYDGRLWGRGSIDMKSTIAAELFAVKAVMDSRIPLRGTVMVGGTVDDEIAGVWGMKYLLDYGFASKSLPMPTIHLLGEPSHLNITCSFKGRLWFKITTLGKSSHGGAPYEGINAIEKMMTLISEFKNIPKVNHPLMGEDTLNLGMIEGGEKVNVVPSRCTAHFDFRMCAPGNEDILESKLRETIKDLMAKDRDFRIKDFEIYEKRDPVEIRSDHEVIRRMSECVEEVTCMKPQFIGSLSAGDLYYSLKRGIPGAWIGSGDPSLFHKVDEHVEIEELIKAAQIYTILILRFCG